MSSRSCRKRPSPERRNQPDPQFLAIGKVLRPHGIRGELRLEVYTDSPHHLDEIEEVYIGASLEPHALQGYRQHQGDLLITIDGSDDRDKAETFRGALVSVRMSDAAPLADGEYYHHQIIGLPVVTDTGEALGQITEIIRTGANDVYVVTGESGEVLLPAIKSVILKIETSLMTVHLPEGLR